MSKQDRQGARTPADVERRYSFSKTFKRMNGATEEARKAAGNAQKVADDAQKELGDKVGKNDDAQIVTMINRAKEIVKFIGKRLTIQTDNFKLSEDGTIEAKNGSFSGKITTKEIDVSGGKFTLKQSENGTGDVIKIDTDNFKLSEDGKVEMRDATIKSFIEIAPGFGYQVSTEIKDGILIIEPSYTILYEGEQVDLEILRFKFSSRLYGLMMETYWGDPIDGRLPLMLGKFYIKEIQEQQN